MRYLLAAAILIIISFEFILALLPPTARDALIYHLAYPKLYLQHGKIFELPFAFYSYYPMNTELLYLAPLYFGKDFLAAYIHMFFGISTAWLIYRYLIGKCNQTYALFGSLVFLSTPVVVKLSTIPYADLALGFYSTGAVLSIIKWRDIRASKWLIISALCAGLAAGTKYNGLFVPLILTFIVLHISKDDRPFRVGLLFFSISVAVASPWYIKNFILTGNPFFPLFFKIFGGLRIPEQPTVPIFLKRQLLYGENRLDIALIPFRVFFQGRDDDMQHFDGVLNPILLLFLPFAFRNMNRDVRYIGVFSLFYFVLVYFTADMQVRFLLPILPLLTIMTVIGVNNLMALKNVKFPVVFVAVALLSLNTIYILDYFKKKDPIPHLIGKVTRDDYLSRHLNGYEASKYINENLPKEAVILMIYTGDRGYYVERDYYYNSYLSGQPIREALGGAKSAGDVVKYLTGKGITHILVDERLFQEFMENNMDEKGKALFSDFSKEYLGQLHSSEGYTVYKIEGRNKVK